MSASRRRSSNASSSSQHSPSLLPHSLHSLRTDSEQNFGFLLSQKPTALEEQRIQRLIEDQLLHEDHPPPPAAHRTEAVPSPEPKSHPPTSLPASITALLPPSSPSSPPSAAFSLADLLPFISHGIEKTIADDFSRCFQSAHSPPWNWNVYLYPLWVLGVLTRYLVLFPLRCLCLLVGALVWLFILLLIKTVVRAEKRGEWERWNLRFFCSAFVLSWTGVIRYHGTIPAHKPDQIYVSNHTSLIDMVILSQRHTFSLVGQRQQGFVGFMQRHVLQCLNNCFFDRGEADDRLKAAQRIKAHIADPSSNRLLIFPEGTCVNNEYCVQFKQGAFDMGAEVVPIAIKYNKIFVDAFWNSRAQSFPMHLLTLMTAWAVVCDVWYLQPQRRREDETAVDFSERVKRMIAERAGLKNVAWDGYLKHFKASSRYMKEQQHRVAEEILRRWRRAGGEVVGHGKGGGMVEEKKVEEVHEEEGEGEEGQSGHGAGSRRRGAVRPSSHSREAERRRGQGDDEGEGSGAADAPVSARRRVGSKKRSTA